MRFFSVVLYLLNVSLNSSAQPDSTYATHIESKKYNIAIFPAESKELFYGNNRFTPNLTEINAAENALTNQLVKLNADRQNQYVTPVIDKHLANYKRQYFGYIDKNGNKILFINCFWKRKKEEDEIWLKERIRVLDGGSYYWNVKYNLKTDELNLSNLYHDERSRSVFF